MAKKARVRRPIPDPRNGYFMVPNEWIDILSQMSSISEVKVITYLMRHTWGFGEFSEYKRITLDEFQHGRKRADGSRMDKGTGLSEQSVITGLKLAMEDGHIKRIVNDKDKARISISYAINMESDSEESEDGPDSSQSFRDHDHKTLGADTPTFGGRSEKDTLEKHHNNTLQKSFIGRNNNTLQNNHIRKNGTFDIDRPASKNKEIDQVNDELHDCAVKLHRAIYQQGWLRRKVDVYKWRNELDSFLYDNDVLFKDFVNVVEWYCANIGKEFVPEAYSAASFCEKYYNIYRAMRRSALAGSASESKEDRKTKILENLRRERDARPKPQPVEW